jgi:CotS family spore coat protein
MCSRIETIYGIKIRKAVKVYDIYMIQTADGTFCLKGYTSAAEEVLFIANILFCLQEHGFTRGQKVSFTVEQAPYTEIDGVYYMLTNWVDGQRPDFRNIHEFKKAIRALAKFHSVSEKFPLAGAPAARIRYFRISEKISRYKEVLHKYKATQHLASLCDQVLDGLTQPKAMKAIEEEQKASAFVHGDYNYPNMLKDKHGKIHLIDFENSSLYVRMQDLSHILHRNFVWNASGMLRWVEYYDRNRPLSGDDMHLLHLLLTVPYHVVRNIKIGGIRHALSVIPGSRRLRKYQRELEALL